MTEIDTDYLIRKGAYYYRPNAQGYTISKDEAGRYTLADAIAYTHPNGPDGPRDGLSYEPAPAAVPNNPVYALRETLVDAVETAFNEQQAEAFGELMELANAKIAHQAAEIAALREQCEASAETAIAAARPLIEAEIVAWLREEDKKRLSDNFMAWVAGRIERRKHRKDNAT